MQYDTDRLQTAFQQFKAVHEAPLKVISQKSGVSPATVHRIISFGVGRQKNVDRVAKVLSFKNGWKDVVVVERKTA